jgi:hypothetical protein
MKFMYHGSDLRSGLERKPSVASPGGHYDATYVNIFDTAPQAEDALGRHWYVRGENFVIAYSEADSGATFERVEQQDEYVVLLPDAETVIEVAAQGEGNPFQITRLTGPAIAFVPPGSSVIKVAQAGRVIRLLTDKATDLLTLSGNNATYANRHERVAPLEPWPVPKGGWKVRTYSLDVPANPQRFGRIWRCTTFMVNWFHPHPGPRDIAKMSPHHHDDFEQCSLALEGDFIHHLRWPWTVDMNDWREDEHAACGSPSIAVIPPPAIHTSQALAEGNNILIDIFSPPRLDFSQKPGWVLNADEYGMPDA